MSRAEQVPGVGGMRWSQVRDVSGVSGWEAGSAGPPPASPHKKDAAERERDARPLLLPVQDWLPIRWVRSSSPGRRLPVPATPAAGRPHAWPGRYGAKEVPPARGERGGGAPRHPSAQGWGCARKDGPGGMRREGPPYPRPHSPGPTQPWEKPPSSCGSSPVSPAPGEMLPAPRGVHRPRSPTRVRPRNPHSYGGPVAPLDLVVDLKSVLRPPLRKRRA